MGIGRMQKRLKRNSPFLYRSDLWFDALQYGVYEFKLD